MKKYLALIKKIPKLYLIGGVAFIFIIIFAVYYLTKSNEQTVVLHRDLVTINEQGRVVLPSSFVEYNADGTLTLPKDILTTLRTDSAERTYREYYINKHGDSVPIIIYRKSIYTTRNLHTPTSESRIKIPSEFFRAYMDEVEFVPEIVEINPNTIIFHGEPVDAVSYMASENATAILLVLAILIAGVGYYYFTYPIEVYRAAKKRKLDVTLGELKRMQVKKMPVDEAIFLISMYDQYADLGIDWWEMKDAYTFKVYDTSKSSSFEEMKRIEKNTFENRKIFETFLATLRNCVMLDLKEIVPKDFLKKFKKDKELQKVVDQFIKLKLDGININYSAFQEADDPTKFAKALTEVKKKQQKDITPLMAQYARRKDFERVTLLFYSMINSELNVDYDQFQRHHLMGGNVERLLNAMIKARNLGVIVNFEDLAHLELAGHDIEALIIRAQYPRIFNVVPFEPVAKDHVKLDLIAEATVRINLRQYANNPGEDTLKARLTEALLTQIGKFETFTDVIKNPAAITLKILDQKLDADTSLELISFNITKIIKKELDRRYRRFNQEDH